MAVAIQTNKISTTSVAAPGGDTGTCRLTLSVQVLGTLSVQVGYSLVTAPVYVLLFDAKTEEPLYETLATWTDAGELTYAFDVP